MKKTVHLSLWFAVIAIVLTSCHGKQASEPAKTEDIKAEVQITRELKDELIKTFEEYQQFEFNFFKSMKEGRDEKVDIIEKIALPLNLAEKSQTLDQKYFLLGMYLSNVLGIRYFFGVNDEERAKIIAKLAVEVNMPALASIDWEQEMKKTFDEIYNKKAEDLLADFKTALDDGNADGFIQIALGTYIQVKYVQSIVREAIGELANAQPPMWETHVKIENCIIELVDKMLPFYPSLEATLPVVNEMRALHEEMTDEEMEVAYSRYLDRIIARRAAFIAELQ